MMLLESIHLIIFFSSVVKKEVTSHVTSTGMYSIIGDVIPLFIVIQPTIEFMYLKMK